MVTPGCENNKGTRQKKNKFGKFEEFGINGSESEGDKNNEKVEGSDNNLSHSK